MDTLAQHQARASRARWAKPEHVERRVDALAAHIRKVVDRLPPLTPEQRDRLRAVLGGSTSETGG